MQKGRDALRWAASLLAQQGVDKQSAWLEASLLLGKAWQKNKTELLTSLDELLDKPSGEAFRHLLERRLNHEPVQYLLGEKEFMGLRFLVTPDVLIPRDETELLVQAALKLSSPFAKPRILDLCTGSGAIAVSIAHYKPQSRVWAADISEAALEVARTNARNNQTADRMVFLCGDMFAPFCAGEKFEMIVCNPPYISPKEYLSLSPEVKKEPRLALYGGVDGLDFYRVLGEKAPFFLTEEGVLLAEIGWEQGPAVAAIFKNCGFIDIQISKDWNNLDRIIIAKKEK